MKDLNQIFLQKLDEAFWMYLETGARSNEKLKPIHSFIADSLHEKLCGQYRLCSLRQGVKGGEKTIPGRYMEKNVDIAVMDGDKPIAAVGFKFVMSNYKQNSNNYFENMLGETANIRCYGIPYFQILVLLEDMPYYKQGGEISRFEHINENNINKYIALSRDDTDIYLHTPLKTLIYLVKLQEKNDLQTKQEYIEFYTGKNLSESDKLNGLFSKAVISNDFEKFIDKVSHCIQGL